MVATEQKSIVVTHYIWRVRNQNLTTRENHLITKEDSTQIRKGAKALQNIQKTINEMAVPSPYFSIINLKKKKR